MTDNERQAAQLIDAMVVARSIGQHDEAARCWREAVKLIEARAPEQVRQMEIEKGLL